MHNAERRKEFMTRDTLDYALSGFARYDGREHGRMGIIINACYANSQRKNTKRRAGIL